LKAKAPAYFCLCSTDSRIRNTFSALSGIIASKKVMNTSHENRRSFLKAGLLAGASLISTPFSSRALNQIDMQEKKEPIHPDLVREFVVAGHGNLEKVKEMLSQTPGLLNATWDWGAGDFETALGGAGHMGRADIADHLISQGARLDVFCAAMLGKLDIVKGTLQSYPGLKLSKGPHGLTLLHHARQGGERSKPVLDYLTELGAS
jgi:hypothetical protein